MDIEKERIARIRDLNDAFRRTFSDGRVMITSAVNALPSTMKAKALELVRAFDQFSEGNDPYGEHDFGSFELVDCTFFWKIDYYDQRCEFGSEDPSDPKRTMRVLTLMLSHEY
jgi:hypothetical protein